MKAIKNRFSVSEFTDKNISKEDLIEILNCGILAPSVKNTQPWFISVLRQNPKQKFTDFLKKNLPLPLRERSSEARVRGIKNRTISALKSN